MLGPGDLYDRYRIEDILGEGGMGRVYRALDTKLQRRVALKVLRIDDEGDAVRREDAKARMMREARSAAALDHPNAVSIFDVGEVDGTPYIAMELVPGHNLRSFVGDHRIPWESKLRWMVDVGAALAAAHEAGLVHRDVKPENVVVRDDGRIKVLDFGIARRATAEPKGEDATHPQHGVGTLTGKGVIVGTLQYMPPEQIGARPIDGRADQFAWAVTAYELLAGSTPWPSNVDALATVSAILTQPPAPLAPLVPDLPAEVVAAIMRALAKAPEERFASMGELLQAIEPFAAPVARSSASVRPEGTSQPAIRAPGSGRTDVDPHAHTALQKPSTHRGVAVDAKSGTAGAPPVRSRKPVWAASVGAAVLVTAVGLLAWKVRGNPSPATAASAVPSALPKRAGVTLEDLPRPATQNPQALAAYLGGMTALRDGDVGGAERLFNDAARLDPGIPGARLRVAILEFYRGWVNARGAYHKALELRASLSPHDQALLDALEPAVEREPADWAEAEQRLRQAVKRFPGDAELHYNLSRLAMMQGQLRAADEAADLALEDDPHMAAAYDAKIYAAQREGNSAKVEHLYEACLSVAPQATQCVRRMIISQQWLGNCDAVENEARTWSRIDADSAEALEYLAQAEYANGKPVDLVETVLRQAWAKEPEDERAFAQSNDLMSLAIVQGNVAGTERAIAGVLAAAEPHAERFYHAVPAYSRVALRLELGDAAGAAKVAQEYLRKEDAWAPDVGSDPLVISNDLTPYMLGVAFHGGALSAEERATRRAAWLTEWKGRLRKSVVPNLWIYAYAFAAETEADANEALATMPDYEPIPPFRPYNGGDASVGHVYLLAGRVDDALPILRRSAKACDAVEQPFFFVQGKLWLGQAEDAKGNRDAACVAYKDVLSHWGGMTKSRAAATARSRVASLGCSR